MSREIRLVNKSGTWKVFWSKTFVVVPSGRTNKTKAVPIPIAWTGPPILWILISDSRALYSVKLACKLHMCTLAPLSKNQALWYLWDFVILVMGAMLINGQTKAIAPKSFPSFLLFFGMLSLSEESWFLNLARRFSRCFFQQLSSSYPSFLQNVHLVRTLVLFLRLLLALDAASALASTVTVIHDLSRSLAVRLSIVRRFLFLTLLWIVEYFANAY